MNRTRLLINAYYERLYERLEPLCRDDACAVRAEQLLRIEIADRAFGRMDTDSFTAYLDTCLAFVAERLEMYNPTGIQFTFPPIPAEEAIELESQLNWYDSRPEFKALCETARLCTDDESLCSLADELISHCGPYPNRSIIAAYRAAPALNRLPDYIASLLIDESLLPP